MRIGERGIIEQQGGLFIRSRLSLSRGSERKPKHTPEGMPAITIPKYAYVTKRIRCVFLLRALCIRSSLRTDRYRFPITERLLFREIKYIIDMRWAECFKCRFKRFEERVNNWNVGFHFEKFSSDSEKSNHIAMTTVYT